MTVRIDRARALIALDRVRIDLAGPDSVYGSADIRPPRSLRREGCVPRTFLIGWTAAGWTCECEPRQPGPCPHLLAVRMLLQVLDPTHPAVMADPWERVPE